MSRKGGHHGGAWKVAYADFVTAMMALFLVLWLTAQDTKIKEAIERAFRNPFSSVTPGSTGLIPQKEPPASAVRGLTTANASAVELKYLRTLAADLLRSLHQEESEENQSFKLEPIPDGLRISIFDRARKPIFQPGSVTFTEYGSWVFSTLAWEIARYKTLMIELEGHTDTRTDSRAEYSNWELSADRANAARRKILTHGVGGGQIRKVAGFADTAPMPNLTAEDEMNNRVTVLLKAKQN